MRRATWGAPVALMAALAAAGGCGCGGNGTTGGEGGSAATSSGSTSSGSTSSGSSGSGGDSGPPTLTCKERHDMSPMATDGVYMIDPDGAGPGVPFKVYCDMTTDGGGWMLLATLKTTTMTMPAKTGGWDGWTDDWWINPHGDATSPKNALTNLDVRPFKPLVTPTSILRMTTPASPVSRYHFGIMPADWDLWDKGRYAGGVNVVGPFEVANVMVSKKLDLSGPVMAHLNGHWFNGVLSFGAGPLQGDLDTEMLAARYQTESLVIGQFAYAGEVRADTTFSFWLR